VHCGTPLPQMRFSARFFSCTPFSNRPSARRKSMTGADYPMLGGLIVILGVSIWLLISGRKI
jgi:hypothetical protein